MKLNSWKVKAFGLVAPLLLAGGALASDIVISWQETGHVYGNGYLPKVASDGFSSVASIAQTSTGFASLEYWTGFYSGVGVTWGSTVHVPTQIIHAPSIALAYGTNQDVDNAIEVHQGGQDSGGALWYQLGKGSAPLGGTISWFTAKQYDIGYNPTVAADLNGPSTKSTAIVEVHQAAEGESALWYHVGKLTYASTPTITWGPSHEINGGLNHGYAPTVSVANNEAILVAQGSGGSLWYAIGEVNTSTDEITWTNPTTYASGYNPTVSVYGDGLTNFFGFPSGRVLVEAHQQDAGTGPLLYRTGVVNGATPTSITWTPNTSTDYSKGCYPSVALAFTELGFNLSVTEIHSEKCGGAETLVASFGLLEP